LQSCPLSLHRASIGYGQRYFQRCHRLVVPGLWNRGTKGIIRCLSPQPRNGDGKPGYCDPETEHHTPLPVSGHGTRSLASSKLEDYTNNKLTPAAGFRIPEEHKKKFAILPVVVGTETNLALRTRRGTGYYKVPSLKGVWYRGPFEHNGSVATLEDWFDPARVRDDYVPTGFKGYGVKSVRLRVTSSV
jgi:hypothetical protein